MEVRVYSYALDILTEDGTLLGQVSVEPDWGPVLECASFEGIRQGQLAARMGSHPGVIEPIWDAARGEPHVSGFRAVITGGNGGVVSREFPLSYLRPLAQAAATTFVQQGLLKAGGLFRFRACAFVGASVDSRPGASGELVLEEIVDPLPLGNTPLRSLVTDGSADEGRNGQGDDMPVVIPKHVIDEAVSLCRQAQDVEVGGVLVGRLHRDPESNKIFLEVTAQIPAEHAVSHAAKLMFTAETWAALDAAIKLRCQDEIKLGWWHYHPDWCQSCPPEKRRQCGSSNAFFSAQDINLHRVCFSSAYHIGLLISNRAASGLGWYLFGWRKGEVVARAFHVSGGISVGREERSDNGGRPGRDDDRATAGDEREATNKGEEQGTGQRKRAGRARDARTGAPPSKAKVGRERNLRQTR